MYGVALFNLNPGEVRHEFYMSSIELLVHDSQTDHHIGGVYARIAGGNLSIHRNEAVEQFINESENHPTFEWMLFLDSDLKIPSDTVAKLMEIADPVHWPVVAGHYVNVDKDGNVVSMFYDYHDDQFHHLTADTIQHHLDNGITNITIDGCGAGCLLIHRTVIDKMTERYGWPMPLFSNDIVAGVVQGEDFGFCLRCKEMNIPIRGALNTNLTHIKPHGITMEHLLQQTKELV